MNLPWRRSEKRSETPISFDEWAQIMTFGGNQYGLGLNTTLQVGHEEVSGDFGGLIRGAYKQNGVIFACMLTRMLLFSEARFQFRERRAGRPGNLYGTPALVPLERPWANGTTGDLLSRMIQDADLGGNAYIARRNGEQRVRRLRPDWVSIVLGSNLEPDQPGWASDAEVVGYIYHPGGYHSNADVELFDRDEVAHFAPIPDPEARFRGMSWLTPVLREIMADGAMTRHRMKFFEQGATPNVVVKTPIEDPEKFKTWVELMREKSEGLAHAYKTLYLGAGSDATVVGANFQQIEFKVTQGAGETRIAAAAGVPPVIVGLSEGLQAATYSNYGQARRRLADGTMRPLWRNAAGSLATIVPPPNGSELWYDLSDIAFLREDEKDAAEIAQGKAVATKTLVDAGYEPDTVIDAIESGDFLRLKHTGLVSVQLQPPGSQTPPAARDDGSATDLALVALVSQVAATLREDRQADPELVSVLSAIARKRQEPTTDPRLIETLADLATAARETPAAPPELLEAIRELNERLAAPPTNGHKKVKTIDFGDGRVAVVREEED